MKWQLAIPQLMSASYLLRLMPKDIQLTPI